jgi:hypothetical protein
MSSFFRSFMENYFFFLKKGEAILPKSSARCSPTNVPTFKTQRSAFLALNKTNTVVILLRWLFKIFSKWPSLS